MYRVRFGNNVNFHHLMASYIDHNRFHVEYGLDELTKLEEYDCVVALFYDDYPVFRSNPDLFGVKFWHPMRDVIDLCDDKLTFSKNLISNGFGHLVPPLIDRSSQTFPYVLKRRFDWAGRSTHIIKDSNAFEKFRHLIYSPDYFTQTCVLTDTEYAFHFLAVDGEILYTQFIKYKMDGAFQVKGYRADPLQVSLISPDYYVDPESRHLEMLAELILNMRLTGLFCLDYKPHNGVPMVLEINPRAGLSLGRDINRFLEVYIDSLAFGNAARWPPQRPSVTPIAGRPVSVANTTTKWSKGRVSIAAGAD